MCTSFHHARRRPQIMIQVPAAVPNPAPLVPNSAPNPAPNPAPAAAGDRNQEEATLQTAGEGAEEK